jgi:hypothetical protein
MFSNKILTPYSLMKLLLISFSIKLSFKINSYEQSGNQINLLCCVRNCTISMRTKYIRFLRLVNRFHSNLFAESYCILSELFNLKNRCYDCKIRCLILILLLFDLLCKLHLASSFYFSNSKTWFDSVLLLFLTHPFVVSLERNWNYSKESLFHLQHLPFPQNPSLV